MHIFRILLLTLQYGRVFIWQVFLASQEEEAFLAHLGQLVEQVRQDCEVIQVQLDLTVDLDNRDSLVVQGPRDRPDHEASKVCCLQLLQLTVSVLFILRFI